MRHREHPDEQAREWLGYAEADLAAAEDLLKNHPTIAAYHAPQAAEKGLKALQIERDGDYDRTHDLLRLYHELGVPEEYFHFSRSSTPRIRPLDIQMRRISSSNDPATRYVRPGNS